MFIPWPHQWYQFALAQYWGLPLWAWLAILVFLGALTYTGHIIKHEKNFLLKHAHKYTLGPFAFSVPSWWDLHDQGPGQVSFERKRTNYGWRGELSWLTGAVDRDLSVEATLQELLQKENIVFDNDVDVTQNPVGLIGSQHMVSQILDFYRMEGRATQNQDTRLYLDLCAFRLKQRSGIFIGWNSSSVLSGTIEGPYFEDVLKNLRFRNEEKEEANSKQALELN